jgi:hypothetical protein
MLFIEIFFFSLALAQNGGKSDLFIAIPSLIRLRNYVSGTRKSAISLSVEELKTECFIK